MNAFKTFFNVSVLPDCVSVAFSSYIFLGQQLFQVKEPTLQMQNFVKSFKNVIPDQQSREKLSTLWTLGLEMPLNIIPIRTKPRLTALWLDSGTESSVCQHPSNFGNSAQGGAERFNVKWAKNIPNFSFKIQVICPRPFPGTCVFIKNYLRFIMFDLIVNQSLMQIIPPCIFFLCVKFGLRKLLITNIYKLNKNKKIKTNFMIKNH